MAPLAGLGGVLQGASKGEGYVPISLAEALPLPFPRATSPVQGQLGTGSSESPGLELNVAAIGTRVCAHKRTTERTCPESPANRRYCGHHGINEIDPKRTFRAGPPPACRLPGTLTRAIPGTVSTTGPMDAKPSLLDSAARAGFQRICVPLELFEHVPDAPTLGSLARRELG